MACEYWPVEYASDALTVLFEKENELRTFRFQSPQLSSRSTLVKWILKLGEQFKFAIPTVHLAVFILDRFMDGHSIEMERLYLAALASLQLAAKFEERVANVPKISELNSLVDNQYQSLDFVQFESCILKYLDWNLSSPTTVKFVEYFSLVAVSPSEWNSHNFSSYEGFWHEIQQAIKEYLKLSLQDVRMLRFKPSQVACSCIILARHQLGIKPLWTHRLRQTTRYKFSQMISCAHSLLKSSQNNILSRKRKLTESPDQGYVTEDSSSTTPQKKVCLQNLLTNLQSC